MKKLFIILMLAVYSTAFANTDENVCFDVVNIVAEGVNGYVVSQPTCEGDTLSCSLLKARFLDDIEFQEVYKQHIVEEFSTKKEFVKITDWEDIQGYSMVGYQYEDKYVTISINNDYIGVVVGKF